MAAESQAEIAASVAALQELGPGYDQALAEGLVERIGADIDKRIAAREYTRENGDDIPEVREWVWPDARAAGVTSSIDATAATGGDNE